MIRWGFYRGLEGFKDSRNDGSFLVSVDLVDGRSSRVDFPDMVRLR